MTNLTMGQRIAAQRKLAGLSQEALSEQLDVSRQAISKWESDGAIPEIDKLIALGRIFGVSVGWLLGTETECRFDPDAGLNENQTKMVEEIAARYQPKQTALWKRALAAACAAALVGGLALHYQSRIDQLSAENAATQTQLAQLTQTNQDIQSQLDAMKGLLEKQDSAAKILGDYSVMNCSVSEDLKNVTMTFVLSPKVYQESLEAWLVVTSPSGESQAACRWDGAEYIVRITVALEDGYEFSFRLVGEDSWQEERLNDRDPYLGMLKTLSAFYIDPADPKFDQMLLGESTPWPVTDTTYTFTTPVCQPAVLPQSATGYKDIVFVLYHNDQAIWEESWKEEFLGAYGAHRLYSLPVTPDLSVELPALAAGDRLRLEIHAELYGGQLLTSVVDDLTVTG